MTDTIQSSFPTRRGFCSMPADTRRRLKTFVSAVGGEPDDVDTEILQSLVAELHFAVLDQRARDHPFNTA